jgi:GNAT superfamily N-acetyltransferase
MSLPVEIHKLSGPDDTQKACMGEVPTPWPEALCQCRDWITQNLGMHVEGYHMQLEGGSVIGHLYYAPSEQALFPYLVEPGVGVMYCDWVQQRYQGHGLGKRLFDTFINDLRKAETKGVLIEASDRPGQMYYQIYLKRGFNILQETAHHKLLYLPLSQTRIEVQSIKPRMQYERKIPVEIVIINSYMCPYEVASQIILHGVVKEYGDRVFLRELQLTTETLQEYGNTRGIFINGRQKLQGGETEEAIRLAILEEL